MSIFQRIVTACLSFARSRRAEVLARREEAEREAKYGEIDQRIAAYAKSVMLEYLEPIPIIQKFTSLNPTPPPEKGVETIKFKRPIPFPDQPPSSVGETIQVCEANIPDDINAAFSKFRNRPIWERRLNKIDDGIGVRTGGMLRDKGIFTVAELLQSTISDEEFLRMPNFGNVGLYELTEAKRRLRESVRAQRRAIWDERADVDRKIAYHRRQLTRCIERVTTLNGFLDGFDALHMNLDEERL